MLTGQVTPEVHAALHLRRGALKVSPHLGSVLIALRKSHPNLKITAVVRNPPHVDEFRRLGVEVVQVSFSDANLTSRARESDITINTVSSDSCREKSARRRGQKDPGYSFAHEWSGGIHDRREGREARP